MLVSSFRRTAKNTFNKKNNRFINCIFYDSNNDNDNCKGIKKRNVSTLSDVINNVSTLAVSSTSGVEPLAIVSVTGVLGTAFLLSKRYYVAEPNEMLSCTGPFMN